MAINYVLVERGNPSDNTAPKKFYAQAKSKGEVNLKQLSREIAEGSTTVSDSDVLAVLNDLTKYMRRHVVDGKIVRFGDFGSFYITLNSEGSDTAEQFHVKKIKKVNVRFRPGSDINEATAVAKFTRGGQE